MFNQTFRLSTAFCNHCKLLHLQKIIRFTLIDAHADDSHKKTCTMGISNYIEGVFTWSADFSEDFATKNVILNKPATF